MGKWMPWIAGALALAAIVYFLSDRVQNRIGKDDKAPEGELVGNGAPDFEGDFAVNGKPVKLSELKGKVVLVDFWAVWCDPCIGTFPHLREWNQKYKKDGLEIVGITMYNYESGRNFGFNKENGKAIRIEKADKTSEQQLLRDFARYYQLEYMLMTIPASSYSRVTNAYKLQGYPQVAVIDRSGIVRLVCVGGGEANAHAIENEIKKLIAQRS